MPLTRRELIRTGLAGSALLAFASCAHRAMSPRSRIARDRYPYRVLDPQQRETTAAIARVMLSGALPTEAASHADALVHAVRGVDTAVAGLPPAVQSEIAQLYALLVFPLTRVVVAGIPTVWSEATDAQIASFLTRWRFSGITLMRSGYDALHQLIMAGWYGQNSAWPRIGYDGPPKLAQNLGDSLATPLARSTLL